MNGFLFNNKRSKIYASGHRKHPTKQERSLQIALQSREELKDILFQRQKIRSNFILDFYFPECDLVVEVDGPNHLLDQKQVLRDKERTDTLVRGGCTILRFSNQEIDTDVSSVVNKILSVLKELKDKGRWKWLSPDTRARIRDQCKSSIIQEENSNEESLCRVV